MMKKNVFSGMRPTGRLHLGHMAGALTNWVALQEEHNCFFSIVDWHALMSDYADSSRLKHNTKEILLDWLAVGLDPEKCVIFVQSHVRQHVELQMAFSLITPLGWLERNPTYKDQILNLQNKDLSTHAFLGYPVLQAADILLYKAELVPVGEDQSAHLELSREIVRRFNHFFGPVFPEPQTLLTSTPKIPGTDGRKMSKSYNNSLEIADDLATLEKKLKTMVTDPARVRLSDPGTPEKCPVWDLHRFFNADENEKAEIHEGCTTAGIGCIACKKMLFKHVANVMEPIQKRRQHFTEHGDALMDILHDGQRRASAVAEKTMDEVYASLGVLGRL